MKTNAHKVFEQFGQSLWLDTMGRELIDSGHLARLRDAGIRGATSNPSIFFKSISSEGHYDAPIAEAAKRGASTDEIYLALVTRDIQDACDILRPVFDESAGRDGFLSLELPPRLAGDSEASIREALLLVQRVKRSNLMIKIPGTEQGFPAVEEAIYQGVSVNITLLFSLEQYQRAAEAFVRGLERRLDEGKAIHGIESVASFFVSRVDTACDRMLEELAAKTDEGEAKVLRDLKGRAGIANCKLAYGIDRELMGSARWKRLAGAGARSQRLLWASTSTKNPDFPDTLYVDQLIGPDTVNTLPEKTLDAFLDHGQLESPLALGAAEAEDHFRRLQGLGIDIKQVCAVLLEEGLAAFAKSMNDLMDLLDQRRRAAL